MKPRIYQYCHLDSTASDEYLVAIREVVPNYIYHRWEVKYTGGGYDTDASETSKAFIERIIRDQFSLSKKSILIESGFGDLIDINHDEPHLSKVHIRKPY